MANCTDPDGEPPPTDLPALLFRRPDQWSGQPIVSGAREGAAGAGRAADYPTDLEPKWPEPGVPDPGPIYPPEPDLPRRRVQYDGPQAVPADRRYNQFERPDVELAEKR
jgi:hypothetical protein